MPTRIIVRRNEYHDSMVLMQLNHRVGELPGVTQVAILMATDNNKPILAHCGFVDKRIDEAGPADLVIGLETTNVDLLDETIANIERLLREVIPRPRKGKRFASFEAACNGLPGANLALISVPGQFAGREARKALMRNLHVFLFSDNVPLEEEIELKRFAEGRGLLLMGPDCGTAIVNGVGLGFANVVQKGPVGIVGASGTGIQEICVLLERFGGIGVSHAIGTGGRDLSEVVGGKTALHGLEFLDRDPGTRCIVFISKPASRTAMDQILGRLRASKKKAVACFLGLSKEELSGGGPVCLVDSAEDAARQAVLLSGGILNAKLISSTDKIDRMAREQVDKLMPGQRFLRGIFSGGSFCYEAMTYLRSRVTKLYSNIPIDAVEKLPDSYTSKDHTLLDLGEDEFTRGRVHPMIDTTLVAERIRREASDPDVGIILFDVILGHGTNPDPAPALVAAIESTRSNAHGEGRNIVFVSHVCGTDRDPQSRGRQEEALRRAGVLVMPTNLQATKLAAAIVRE